MTIRIFDYGERFEHSNYDVTFNNRGWLEVTVYGALEKLPWSYANSVDGEIEHIAFHVGFSGRVRKNMPTTEPNGSTPIEALIFPKEWWAIED